MYCSRSRDFPYIKKPLRETSTPDILTLPSRLPSLSSGNQSILKVPTLSESDFTTYLKTFSPEIQKNIKAGRTLEQNIKRVADSTLVNEEIVNEYLNLMSRLADTELEQCTLAKTELHSKLGSGEMTKEQFDVDILVIEESRPNLFQRQIAISRQRRRLSNNILQRLESGVSCETAYTDYMLSTLGKPFGATKWKDERTRKKHQQENWRRQVQEFYDVVRPSEETGSHEIWCPMSHAYFEPIQCKVAHIVPAAMQSPNAGYVFGKMADGEDIIWDQANGIPLHNTVEKAFDDGRIVIVPVENGSNELKVVVLDHTLFKYWKYGGNSGSGDWRVVNGRPLKFLNDRRPRLRYLYFKFVTTLIRRQRYAVEGFWEDRSKGLPIETIWATPGKYLRASLLLQYAELVGAEPTAGYTFTDPETKQADADERIAAMEDLDALDKTARPTGDVDDDDDFDDDDNDNGGVSL